LQFGEKLQFKSIYAELSESRASLELNAFADFNRGGKNFCACSEFGDEYLESRFNCCFGVLQLVNDLGTDFTMFNCNPVEKEVLTDFHEDRFSGPESEV